MSDPTPTPTAPAPSGLQDNAAGALAYLTPIPAIVFLIVEPYNKNPFVRFHSWQSILLAVASFVLGIVFSILQMFMLFLPFAHFAMVSMLGLVSMLVWLGFLIAWLACVFNAYNGKKFSLPIIGGIAEQQANK